MTNKQSNTSFGWFERVLLILCFLLITGLSRYTELMDAIETSLYLIFISFLLYSYSIYRQWQSDPTTYDVRFWGAEVVYITMCFLIAAFPTIEAYRAPSGGFCKPFGIEDCDKVVGIWSIPNMCQAYSLANAILVVANQLVTRLCKRSNLEDSRV